MKTRLSLVLTLTLMQVISAHAQVIAVKTNALYDVTATVNLGVEVGIAPRWTLDISGDYNGWSTSGSKRWKHWMVQPEARWWFCDRFAGHFLAVHAHGGQYNLGGFDGIYNLLGTNATKLDDYRYQGWFIGAGIAYGYAWALAKHWNIEAEIGVGYSYTQFDRFECAGCGAKVDDGDHHYIGPTKAAVNLVYIF